MTPDRDLVDKIKANFARKSSTQLQEITRANDPERWSAEAVAAAGEVLQDRMAGRGVEPAVPEEESALPPPSSGHDVNSVAFVVGLNLITLPVGFLVLPINRAYIDDPIARDRPVPFGPNMAWLALATTDTAGVATELGLREMREAKWVEGIDAAHGSSIFVTPPLADWTLAAGTTLFSPERPGAFVKPLLEGLSRKFGDAQYFCTRRDIELHVWARARRGQLVRGYGWLGDKRLTLWEQGPATPEERELGLPFVDDRSSSGGPVPDESAVMQLACLWSIDPSSLNDQYKEPSMGLLGTPAL